MSKRIKSARSNAVALLLVLLSLTFEGCQNQARTDQYIVDSIFNSYHKASTAFDENDVQKLISYADSCNSRYGAIIAHLDLASIHATNANSAQALYHLKQVEVRPDDPPFALAYTDFIYGLTHQYNTDFDKALFYYKRAADGFERLGKQQALAATYTNMSEIYSEFEAWDMHEKYSSLAHALFEDTMMVGYNSMSDSIYTLIHKGDLTDAYSAWLRQNRQFEKQKLTIDLQFAYIYNHYDQAQTIHYRLGHYDSAAYYNRILMALVADNPTSTLQADLNLAQAKILLRQGHVSKALEGCQQLLNAADSGIVPTNIALEAYPTLLECYTHLHMGQAASLTAIEYGNKLKDYYLQTQRNNLLQTQIEQRYEQLIAQSKQERQHLHNRLMMVLVISLITILALMTIVIYKQRRQHIEQLLRLKSEHELEAAQHRLAESQMKQAKIQEQILTYTYQMRELASDMPKRIKAKTFLNLEQIRQQRDADAWSAFEEAFEQEHGNFKQRLQDQYPQINATDIKICMLMRTGMPSKDIANMLHITPETLRTFRYNLRKKLGLKDQGITLEEFVNCEPNQFQLTSNNE